MGFGAIGAMIGANAISSIFTNDSNKREASRNRNFQAGMSNTAHQREVADLEAAGLNPILSANAGASTAGGSMAVSQAPSIDLPMVYKNRELGQMDTKLNQDQQRINIDKANSAAGIAKNLSSAELDKASAAATKGGILTKWLGTDTYQSGKNAINNAAKFNPLKHKQPSNMNGSR